MFWIFLFVCIVVSYLIGSIPFGLLISKTQGKDIRNFGSGNIGATNVFRVLGARYGIAVFVLDFLKGLLPVIAVKFILVPNAFLSMDTIQIIVGMFAIIGHSLSIYIGFKGGKGVATGAGIAAGIMPIITLILFIIWGIIVSSTKYVSLGSIIAALLLPILILIKRYVLNVESPSNFVLIFCITISVLIIYRHKSNIKRLIKGEENRFGTKKNK